MRARAVFTMLILVGVLVAGADASARGQERDLDDRIKSKENELERLRREIEEQRRKIKEVTEKEKNLSGYLRKLENEEKLTRQLLEGLEVKEILLQEQADSLRKALETNETIYHHRLEILSKRLREMYKDEPHKLWQELLGAQDFADLLQRYKFLTLIAERDADLLDDVRERRAAIERQEAGITEILHEVSKSRREKEDELEKLEENENQQKETLGGLKNEKRRYQRKAEELARAEKDLQSFIEELEEKRLEQAKAWGEYGESDFLGLKGTMRPPVEGDIVREFGRFKHPEYGTVTFSTGIDIEARANSPVRAVARGRIEYASVLPGYGNCIIINHGGGYYTLYAHTSHVFVKQGDQVEGGGVIAETEADPAGVPTPLHFEIRKSKKALDPAEWLSK